MSKAGTIAINIAAVAVIALLMIGANTGYRQWSQFQKGESALASGDAVVAIAGYESAIHMYIPGSPLVSRSAERLWHMGEAFERQGDLERALIAYRSLRSSFYSAKWIVQPGMEWIERCDAKIAPLSLQLKAQQSR